MHDNWLDISRVLWSFYQLYEDYFSHVVPWRPPRYSMNARRRVKTMDITRSCLSLVEVLDIRH